MASIRKQIELDNAAERVWDALRDFHAVHTRVAPGFLTGCTPEEGARVLDFASGARFREMLVDCDDERRRLVYAIAEPPFTSYSASVQVFAMPQDRCRLEWVVDMLPNALAGQVEGQMEIALEAMKGTLEKQ